MASLDKLDGLTLTADGIAGLIQQLLPTGYSFVLTVYPETEGGPFVSRTDGDYGRAAQALDASAEELRRRHAS